jgi:ABC-type branched-subunit amino acid transport system ATPase component
VLLEARGLTKRYGGVVAVDAVDLDVRAGEILALIGPNGAGKTTLFNIVSGVIAPTAGSVTLGGRRIEGRKPHVFARGRATRTFQNLQIFGSMTVVENVMVGRHLRGRAGMARAMLALPAVGEERDIERSARELVELMGLGDDADRLAADLPFGRQRLVEIARALAAEADCCSSTSHGGLSGWGSAAPSHGLARRAGGRAGIGDRAGRARPWRRSWRSADRVAVLDDACSSRSGAPMRCGTNPAVVAAYLGVEETDEIGSSLAPRRGAGRPGARDEPAGRGAARGYGRLDVLHDVDVAGREGELVRGHRVQRSARSTLLRAASGLLRPSAGRVVVAGRRRHRPSGRADRRPRPRARARERLVFPTLSVTDNLVLGGWTRRGAGKAATAQDRAWALDFFPRLQQRTAAARRHHVGRRAADARRRPRPGRAAAGAGSRRAQPRARTAHRPTRSSRYSRGCDRRKDSRSCSSSRTRARHSASPTGRTSWTAAASSCRGSRRSCSTIRGCRPRTSAAATRPPRDPADS